MKKISSKNISKNSKKRKKRRISIYGDELEEEIKPLFEINKDLLFSNIAEMIATSVLEKIILNAFVEIRKKNLYSLMGIQCSNYLLKEINSLLSLSHLCYEKENSFPSDLVFNDNFLRYDIPMEEFDIPQPTPALLDRWKVHRLNLVKFNTNHKNHERRKSREKLVTKSSKRKSEIKDENKNINIKKSLSKTQRNENKNEYTDVIEKAKMQKEALRLFDSFPCFPITESKPETNLTKEEEAQIESLREEVLLKEELMRKEEEKKRRHALFRRDSRQERDSSQKELEEINKYKGKNIGVTTNGEIIFIQSVNVKNLKSEFLEISSKMNNEIENSKRNSIISNVQNRTKYSNKLDKKEIEKNKENKESDDLFKENNQNRINQQVIIGGSSFNNFVPEIGVNLRQGKGVKSGGNDFMNKYNKISFEYFQKTLEMFKKTNKENNELIEIKNDNDTISTVKSRNNKNNDINFNNNIDNNSNNLFNNLNQSNNIMNSNAAMRRNTAIYNFNLSNTVNKNFERSSSLPDIFQANIIANMNNTSTNNNTNNINNDLTIKQSFNFTNYNNSFNFNNNSNINNNNSTRYNNYKHHNMSHFIKTSSSFKNLFFHDEIKNKDNKNNNIIDPNNISTTSTNFFLNFNKNYKILSRPQALISLKKMQTFNSDIVSNNNWGTISQERDIKNNNFKMPFINVMKNSFDKNILRVRSNINEIYTRRKNMVDKLSYRKIENEIKEYRDMSKRGLYKKSKSVK